MAREREGFFFVRTTDGSPPTIDHYALDTGATYYEGQVLRLMPTSGSAILATAGCTAVFGVLSCNVNKFTTPNATKYPVYLGAPNMLFKVKAPASSTPAAKRGDTCDLLVVGATHELALGTTTTKAFTIFGWSDMKNDNSTAVASNSAATGVPYYVKFAKYAYASTKVQ